MHLLKSNGLQFKQISNILDGSTRVFIIPANSLNLYGYFFCWKLRFNLFSQKENFRFWVFFPLSRYHQVTSYHHVRYLMVTLLRCYHKSYWYYYIIYLACHLLYYKKRNVTEIGWCNLMNFKLQAKKWYKPETSEHWRGLIWKQKTC